MLALELMTDHPALITADQTVLAAADLMRVRDVGMLPVVDDLFHKRLVGIVTDRDLVIRHLAREHGASAKVKDVMSRDPLVFVHPNTPVAEVAEEMRRFQVRRLPVVDAAGAVVGVIAQADLAVQVGPTDPQLVERVLEGISRPGALTH